ncbi:MAG: hypothetical protein ACI8QZ_000438, partial [Chlamydiales bacterium]
GQIDLIVNRTDMRSMLATLIDYGTTKWEGYRVAESTDVTDVTGPAEAESAPDA